MTVRLGRGEDIYELLKVYSLNGLLGEENSGVESLETGADTGLPHSVSGADVWIPAIHFETGGASSPHGASGADVWIPAHWLDFGAAVSTHSISGSDVYNKTPLYIDTGRVSSPHGASGADVYHAFADMLIVTEVDGAPLVTDVKRIVFDNGTVTDSGGGVARVTNSGGVPPGYFGDGSDGDVTISVDTDLDVLVLHAKNLTINAGYSLSILGNSYFVKDTLTINGTIINNGEIIGSKNGSDGNPNSGATQGTGGNAGAYGLTSSIITPPSNQAGTAGGAAGLVGATGNNADWGFNTMPFKFTSNTMQSGAAGGNGAVGIGGAGGDGAEADPYPHRSFVSAITISTSYPISSHANSLPGGAGGGGGGATAGGGGGGGAGGNGGNIVIVAKNIVWGASGLIDCSGGNGGNGGNSDGDGGGGGGGSGGNGGIVILCYETETGSRDVDVSKGTGGTGGTSVSASAGANGPDGYDGVTIDLGA